MNFKDYKAIAKYKAKKKALKEELASLREELASALEEKNLYRSAFLGESGIPHAAAIFMAEEKLAKEGFITGGVTSPTGWLMEMREKGTITDSDVPVSTTK